MGAIGGTHDSWGGGSYGGNYGGAGGGSGIGDFGGDEGGYQDFGGLLASVERAQAAAQAQALGPQASTMEIARQQLDANKKATAKQNPHKIGSYVGAVPALMSGNLLGLLKPGADFFGTMSARSKAFNTDVDAVAAEHGVTHEQALGLMGYDFSDPGTGFDRGSNTEPGTVGQYGQGFTGDSQAAYGSPLGKLIQNSIAGLNPTQQPQAQTLQQSQNSDALWNSLIPGLQIGGQTLGDALLANPNFPAYTQTGGIR